MEQMYQPLTDVIAADYIMLRTHNVLKELRLLWKRPSVIIHCIASSMNKRNIWELSSAFSSGVSLLILFKFKGGPIFHTEIENNTYCIIYIINFSSNTRAQGVLLKFDFYSIFGIFVKKSSLRFLKDGILRYLGVLGDKCTNFLEWRLFGIFIAMLFSLH